MHQKYWGLKAQNILSRFEKNVYYFNNKYINVSYCISKPISLLIEHHIIIALGELFWDKSHVMNKHYPHLIRITSSNIFICTPVALVKDSSQSVSVYPTTMNNQNLETKPKSKPDNTKF